MSSKSKKNAAILLALEGIMLQIMVVVSLAVAFYISKKRGTHRQRKTRKFIKLNRIPDQVDSNAGLMHSPSTSTEEEVSDEDEITSPSTSSEEEMSDEDEITSPSTRAEEEASDEDEVTSVYQKEKREANGKKRKSRDEDTSAQLIEMLSVFIQSTEAKFGQILQRIGYEQDAVVRRNELSAQLDKIEGLLMMEKFRVSDELIMRPHKLDIFRGLPETARKDYVQMLLAKMSTVET